MAHNSIWKDKLLFTPGPLSTSRTVKQAMLRDLGSRDDAFIEIVRDVRRQLLTLAGVSEPEYTAIPMQGSGTFAVEAVFSSCVPPDGRVLIIVNGAYGYRMQSICNRLGIENSILEFDEDTLPDLKEIEATLRREAGLITHVAVIHCETTTGIFNDIAAIGALAKAANAQFYVDAMSSFGAVPLNMAYCNIDYLVSSANKCIQGVPGFGFVIAKRSSIEAAEGWARSLSLDLLDQLRAIDKNGQFRFTPPTHVMLAFHQALKELEEEGGVEGRAARYRRNYETLVEGMRALGFREYLPKELQGYIITSFLYPDDPKWSFERFYRELNARDFVIYPGKVSNADCFRIGNIGHMFEADIRALLRAIEGVIKDMGVSLS